MVVQEIAESQSCEPDSERPSVPCEEEQCVLTDGKFVSALESVHNDLLAVWQAVDGNLCIAGERSKFEQSEITSDFPPPLRTHLVLHILLI